ncbi:MAG: ATP-grasp domain-containing protein [Bacteroidetes bacterium]|nr:ATP-grasp domain-containing protein [Bacteroidota bacterium]MBU2585851.1 ATP-grasp domain-containing protein [Bacteroidota bacterium]
MKIAVTGLNNTDNPGPGVPVIRAIKNHPDFDGEIIGLHYDNLEPGIYMDGLIVKSYLIPYPSGGTDDLLKRIRYIQEKEKIDVIIPTLDSELNGFIRINDTLRSLGIKTFLPTLDNLEVRSKERIYDFGKTYGINVPNQELVNSLNELEKAVDILKYPVVVKGIFYEAYICHSFEQVESSYYRLLNKWGLPIILQEFLAGDEYNVAAVGDGNGITIGAVAMRKLYITDKGKGWAGVTIDDDNLIKMTHDIIRKVKWRSGLELEILKRSEDNQYYMLEINSRLPAWVYLTEQAGQNLPYCLVQLALGKKIEPYKNYEIGKMFIRCSYDLISDMKTFEKISVFGEL